MPEARRGFGRVFRICHHQSLGSRFHPMTWGWQDLFLLQDVGACPGDGAGSAGPPSRVARANRPSTSVQGKPLLLLPQPSLCFHLPLF